MIRRARGVFLLLAMAAGVACAQQNAPHAAFVYPAGGRLGTTFEVTVGGQNLEGAKQAFFFGDGVKAEVVGFSKPLPQKELDDLRAQLKDLEQSHSNAPAAQKAVPKPQPAPTPGGNRCASATSPHHAVDAGGQKAGRGFAQANRCDHAHEAGAGAFTVGSIACNRGRKRRLRQS
jgi:hypothetical protein